MADVKAIAEELVNLTVKEVSELKTILKDEYGIEPAAAAVAVVLLLLLVLQLVVRLLLKRRLHSTLFSRAQVLLSFRL